ncbi:MAG: hypothetical protein II841_11380 [Bacteroidales bacterium]|nr:hypothetical protein [Bacteroidales bacterium]
MSLDYWHLSLSTVQLAFRYLDVEYKVTGTAQFRFRQGSDWYYLRYDHLPELFFEREVDPMRFLPERFSLNTLFSAMNSVNDKYHLVKVAVQEDGNLIFRLCLREDRYLSFREAFFQYVRELDDAVESFAIACKICVTDEEDGEAEKGIPYDKISEWLRKEEYHFFNKKDVQS